MLKILGFGGALVLSVCATNLNDSESIGLSSELSKPTNIEPSSNKNNSTDQGSSDQSQSLETDTLSPTEPPSEVPLTLEEELAIIQTPIDIDPLSEDAWTSLPIIPAGISDRMLKLFKMGKKMGRDPRQFAVVGDCHSSPVFFLKNFDDPPPNPRYNLGKQYQYLQETIDYYKGSFNTGVGARNGQNVTSVLSAFWADPERCEPSEGPLACELRIKNPAFAFISLEKNWWGTKEEYTTYLETIINYTIGEGIIPILGTKAHNLEGEHFINHAVVEVARRYEIPLWNFWASVQDVPRGGLEEDLEHLSLNLKTYYDFSDPQNFDNGWALRNLTGLMILDFMRKSLINEIGLGHQMVFMLERWILNS